MTMFLNIIENKQYIKIISYKMNQNQRIILLMLKFDANVKVY